ncbi:3-methyl-2-oxobutanoate hydroxymethyltransferase [Acidovorax sp. Be4]|uniref:3-methyl-2-oxobutanoate hydroxymethyltransferase n=1 Tax=Acidovorax bellezanensis TaxID=2976702 RepID=A0ABT2PHT1_9BURK|nr:3-methyl-2-oxobutanoate hydroxymethyltransferase [Acidovorax sp. Be4]MCT9810010.1 3-methyl-2-oxobutanoate hydroxymethyltransferase [Acidovorax sp. Be4]
MKSTTEFQKFKRDKRKIVMVTAYDYPGARYAEAAGADTILVGDSLGMVVLGYDSTVPVTVDDMVHHAKAVRRGAPGTCIVLDMPFGSYHASLEVTTRCAVDMLQRSGADALKVEGAGEVIDVIRRLTQVGIPVVAHLGLTPQSAAVLGGYVVQGKDFEAAQQILRDAQACEAAGACALVLECVPQQLAAHITAQLGIPTIGIGAGPATDGQVLVFHDLLGYGNHRVPKFVQQFAQVGEQVQGGLTAYAQAVRSGKFPGAVHSFNLSDSELGRLYGGAVHTGAAPAAAE